MIGLNISLGLKAKMENVATIAKKSFRAQIAAQAPMSLFAQNAKQLTIVLRKDATRQRQQMILWTN